MSAKKKAKVASKAPKPLPFKAQVKPPYGELVGKKFTVLGSWWGDCAEADKTKEFNLVVEQHEADHDFGLGKIAPGFRLKWIQV
jgi:hypothetical protein